AGRVARTVPSRAGARAVLLGRHYGVRSPAPIRRTSKTLHLPDTPAQVASSVPALCGGTMSLMTTPSRILVVDDAQAIAEMVGIALRGKGYEDRKSAVQGMSRGR